MLGSIPFLLREALANLKRHTLMTVAAVTTIAVALLLLGGFLLTLYEVDSAARHAIADFEMRVFCRAKITPAALKDVRARLNKLPGVATVTYLSREAIWREQTENFPIDTSGIPNEFNDTFVVTLTDARRAPAIARAVRDWRNEVEAVELPAEVMDGALRLAAFVRNAGGVSALVLIVGALIVVSNTVRISVFARRREIKIMQIVGAAGWFIRLPLLIEGLLHGLLGGALASACLYMAGSHVAGLVRDTVPMLTPYLAPVDATRFGLALLAAGALIGALGSLVSIRRYLRAPFEA